MTFTRKPSTLGFGGGGGGGSSCITAVLLLLFTLGVTSVFLARQWQVASDMGSTGSNAESSSVLLLSGLAAVKNQSRQPPAAPGAACALTLGDWCHLWHGRRAPAVPIKQLTLVSKPCPNNCSGIGNCDAQLGICYCPAAWGGPDCSKAVKRPCTHALGGLRRANDSRPYSHIGPDKLDLNLSSPVYSNGRCGGVCDDEYGRCFCRGPGKYGRVPAPPGSPPGTPPINRGRPTHFHCSHPKTGPDGQKLAWGVGPTWQELYGPEGWCVADNPSYTGCGCPYDGWAGPGCSMQTEQTCFNQCSGRGTCTNMGFCKCPSGWYGVDCAYPSTAVQAAAAQQAAEGLQMTAWVQSVAVDAWHCYNSQQGCLEQQVLQVWQRLEAATTAARPKTTDQQAAPPAAAAAEPATTGPRTADVSATSNSSANPAPVQTATRHLAAAAAGRPRPLIYVYNIPDEVLSHIFQYRRIKEGCSWRIYHENNRTELLWDVYGLEVLFLDMMLGSSHRTLNPKEADFFYVPVLAACWMTFVQGEQDWPWFSVDSFSRVKGAVVMYQHALNFVKTAYPFWNASQGADHIWLFAHDEGACWAPAEVYNNSILMTPWARNTPDNFPSHTQYGQDNYTHDITDEPEMPEGLHAVIGHHRCYTPGKDIAVPVVKMPDHYMHSPYLSGIPSKRDILAFHRGRMMEEFKQYSLGVRQAVATAARQGDWGTKHNIWVNWDKFGTYSELLARSVFCFVFQGDGWSARYGDAVGHGCIPVIVLDVADPPFGAELDWEKFSVKIPVKDVPRIPELLTAISPARVLELQSNLGQIWSRMLWLSHPVLANKVHSLVQGNLQAYSTWQQQQQSKAQQTPAEQQQQQGTGHYLEPEPGLPTKQQLQQDAFHTVMQVLHARLVQRLQLRGESTTI